MNTRSTTPSGLGVAGPARATNWLLTGVLAGGPVLTVHLLLAAAARGSLALPVWMYLATALLFWSPLPFSIPAVLLDNYRDAYLPGARGPARLVRAVLLPGWLLSRASGVRVEFAASLAGFAVAGFVAAPALIAVLG